MTLHRTINTAAVTYSSTYPNDGYPASLGALGPGGAACAGANSTNSCLIDNVLATGTKSGYTFTWAGDGNLPSVGYTVTATPVNVGTTGQRQFCSDQSGVIRYDPTGAACLVASSNPLQ